MKEFEKWEGISLADAAIKTDKTETELLRDTVRGKLTAWVWAESLLTTTGTEEKGWLKVQASAIKELIDSESVFVGNFVTPDGREVIYAEKSYKYDPADQDYSSYDDMMNKARYEHDYDKSLRGGRTILPQPEYYFDQTYQKMELLLNKEYLRFSPDEIERMIEKRLLPYEENPLAKNEDLKKKPKPDDSWIKVKTWEKIADFLEVSITTAKRHTIKKRINKRSVIQNRGQGGTKVWAYENDLNEIKNRPAKKMKIFKVNYLK
ncbi:MAG: hypothetical protein Q8R88_00370 [Desulfoprunum sp.]|nr:hypothetical protein [Desulfoprunum sp.]